MFQTRHTWAWKIFIKTISIDYYVIYSKPVPILLKWITYSYTSYNKSLFFTNPISWRSDSDFGFVCGKRSLLLLNARWPLKLAHTTERVPTSMKRIRRRACQTYSHHSWIPRRLLDPARRRTLTRRRSTRATLPTVLLLMIAN